MNRILEHVRGNLVAYLALVRGLGVHVDAPNLLPAGQSRWLGDDQEQFDHAGELDPNRSAGVVRHLGRAVDASGHVLASSPKRQ